MGEAIARFREMALAIRRVCDERHSQPRYGAVTEAAAKKFAKECRLHLLDHEKSGMNFPARYVRGLCRRRNEAERHPDPPPPGKFDLPLYIEWLPEGFAKKEPGYSDMRRAVRDALKEATQRGSLFEVLEARIKALDAAANLLLQYAGAGFAQSPSEKYWCEDETGGGYCGPNGDESDSDYSDCHEKFAEALEALAPFIEEPPASASDSPPEQQPSTAKQKKRRDRKGIGGRKKKYPEPFVRDVLAARKREERACRKSKDRLPPKNEWLRLYCRNRGIDTATMFPSEDEAAPEPWDERANRFWKAVAAREQRAGN